MPDGFDASRVPGVVDIPPLPRRDAGNSTAVRVAEIVMRPLTLLVTGVFALAGMALWGAWTMGARIIRPLLYTLAGMVVATFLLTVGGVAGYAYQLANAKPLPPAALADAPPAAPGMPPFPSLPQLQEAPQPAPAPPQADPFGLKQPGR